MSNTDDTIDTAYGRLDRAALRALESSYDTRVLSTAVEQLDQVLAAARRQDGLRDMLLRLHSMANTVINGAGLSGDAGGESLPELAFDAASDIRDLIATLEGWVKQIEPLQSLQPDDA
jgi:hypothetical protein